MKISGDRKSQQTKLTLEDCTVWRFQETGIAHRPNSLLRSLVCGEQTGIRYRPNSTYMSLPCGDIKRQECATVQNRPWGLLWVEKRIHYINQIHHWSPVFKSNGHVSLSAHRINSSWCVLQTILTHRFLKRVLKLGELDFELVHQCFQFSSRIRLPFFGAVDRYEERKCQQDYSYLQWRHHVVLRCHQTWLSVSVPLPYIGLWSRCIALYHVLTFSRWHCCHGDAVSHDSVKAAALFVVVVCFSCCWDRDSRRAINHSCSVSI